MDKTEKTITFDNLPQAVIGISLTNLSLLKTGKGRAIRFTTLNKLRKVLECVPGDILDYQPDPEGTEMEEDIFAE